MSRIKNQHYKKFLDEGLIEIITEDQILTILKNLKSKHPKQAKALICDLYLTGARPIEVLQRRAKDVTKEKRRIFLQTIGAKRGRPRPISPGAKNQLAKIIYEYAKGLHPDLYLYPNFQGTHKRTYINKKGEIVTYKEISSKLRYHFKKWFEDYIDITPYYLRHNRISKLALAGATDQELQLTKGSKTATSIQPYKHLSKASVLKIGNKIK